MDHFPTVLSICREALSSGSPTIRRNIQKLQKALERQGTVDQAASLGRLLDSADGKGSMSPSHVVLNGTSTTELLSARVQPPADRETGVPLATITFPNEIDSTHFPILPDRIEAAVGSVSTEWRMRQELEAVGLTPPASLLLLGPPGTGKTELARRVACEFRLPLVTARLDGLISSFLGTTARNISTLFEFANRYQCVLLLDEFDALAKVRDDPHEIGEIKRVVNSLLQCLDTRRNKGFTIAVTNHNHLLDPAIWRRFDVTIEVPTPGHEQRVRIVERYMAEISLDETEVEFLAWLTEGESGSEIETLCGSIKRYLVLNRDSNPSVFEATQIAGAGRAGASHSPRAVYLGDLGDRQERLARAMAESSDYRFTQRRIATLMGANQSTVSRWLHVGG